MKFGMRMPSLARRIAARTSWKRYVRHSMGIKVPRGFGWLTNPKKAVYNRVYNRTSFSIDRLFKGAGRGRKAGGKNGTGCGLLIAVIIVLTVTKMMPLLYRLGARLLPVIATMLMICDIASADELTTLTQCKLMPTNWSDGDSFLVQTVEGTNYTIRLYGADCIEWHVTDETDARRLRSQRRYFGISEFGGSPQASMDAAKGLGKAAAEEVVAALAKPFTVNTAFADARGDGRYKRIYGFVTTADGEDLAERLIRLGLARAFGVYRETPAGVAGSDYRALLQDVELQAAKRAVGAWAKTNWDQLPSERLAERQEDADLTLATAPSKLSPGSKINPNTAARDQLMRLPGVGEVTANRIIESRPFKDIRDLQNISGIGEKTFARIAPFLQIP